MIASWPQRAVLAALVLSSAACATAAPAPSEPGPHGRNVLHETDLASVDGLDAFQAVRRLRPQWLSTRGQSVLLAPDREAVVVYLDGMVLGDPSTLKRVPVRNVGEIQHLSAAQATLKLGSGHPSGAILVMTRRGRAPGDG